MANDRWIEVLGDDVAARPREWDELNDQWQGPDPGPLSPETEYSTSASIADAAAATAAGKLRRAVGPVSATSPAQIPAVSGIPEPSPFERLAVWEFLVSVVLVLSWIGCFAAGIVVNTQPYRAMLGEPTAIDASLAAGAWFIVVMCYTITNTAFLSCLAAVIGALAARSLARGRHKAPLRASFDALMYGFFVYLVVISGLLLFTTEAITNPGQAQYVRLAGVISVVAFLTGYDPTLFRRLIDYVRTQSIDRSRRNAIDDSGLGGNGSRSAG